MRLDFLGVRGSTPAPGPDFVRYGGHTSCVSVTVGGASHPTIVLDAGTGLRSLTGRLEGDAFAGTILISHLHWDHMQGIPFFIAGDRPDAQVRVVVPAQSDMTGGQLVSLMLSPPSFPITPAGLKGRWTFDAVDAGHVDVDGAQVVAFDVEHKGGRTFGYSVAADGARVVYVPDHQLTAGLGGYAAEVIRGADVLIHDAQFLVAERPMADDYAHSTVEDAISLAEMSDVGHLVLFHHGPARTDEALDRIDAEFGRRQALRITVAREGESLTL